jgi:hypothetical protein
MTEPTSGAGTGAAHSPTITVENNLPALEAALVAARAEEEASLPARHIASLEAKVAKYRVWITAIEADIATAKAEQKGAN